MCIGLTAYRQGDKNYFFTNYGIVKLTDRLGVLLKKMSGIPDISHGKLGLLGHSFSVYSQ